MIDNVNLLNYSNYIKYIYIQQDIVSHTLSVYNKAIKINFITLFTYLYNDIKFLI